MNSTNCVNHSSQMPCRDEQRRADLTLAVAILAVLLASPSASAADGSRPATGKPPETTWDMEALRRAPRAEWLDNDGPLRRLYYRGMLHRGKPTRVFAYYAVPAGAPPAGGKWPAITLVHGGGGTAFPEWATLWAKRGYAAIAMDLAGRGPGRKPLPDGGPDQQHRQKFDDLRGGVKNAWPYHAVGNVVLATSLLAAQPEVDSDRLALTGISWGGYLTCIVAGLDDRHKAAVPVYGCGFLHDNSCWLGEFEKLGPELTAQWVERFDPSRHLGRARLPMLFVNGANDFAYPLDSYQKSYRLTPGPRTLCIRVAMPHGHRQGWAPREIGWFVDSILKDGAALPRVGKLERKGRQVSVGFTASSPVVAAELNYTQDKGAWQKRRWSKRPAKIEADCVRAALPADRGLVYYFNLTDRRGALVSSEHEELP